MLGREDLLNPTLRFIGAGFLYLLQGHAWMVNDNDGLVVGAGRCLLGSQRKQAETIELHSKRIFLGRAHKVRAPT